jgi:hypothetical protein
LIDTGCNHLDATNASKHSINQVKKKILQIDQSKDASNDAFAASN